MAINKNKIFLSFGAIFFCLGVIFFLKSFFFNKEKGEILNGPGLITVANNGKTINVVTNQDNKQNNKIISVLVDSGKKNSEADFGSSQNGISFVERFNKIYAFSLTDKTLSSLTKVSGKPDDIKKIYFGEKSYFRTKSFFINNEKDKIFILAEKYGDYPGGAVLAVDLEKDELSNVVNLNDTINSTQASFSGNKLFIPSFSGTELLVFDCNKEEIAKKINLPNNLKITKPIASSEGKIVYVLGERKMIALDVESGNVLSESEIKDGAEAIKVDFRGKRAYLIGSDDDQSNGFLIVVDLDKNQVISEVKVGKNPQKAVIGNDYVFILNKKSDSISIIDKKSNELVKNVPTGGLYPVNFAINEDNSRIYVSNFRSNNVGVIDVKSQKLIGTIPRIESSFAKYLLSAISFFLAIISMIIFIILKKRNTANNFEQINN